MFAPGTIVSEFTSKKGNNIVFRFPVIEDVDALTEYINTLSSEDTFITFSGEQMTIKEEHEYLEKQLKELVAGDGIMILAIAGEKFIGSCGLRKMAKRSNHVGLLGISLAKDYRNEGIGSALIETAINLGQKISIQMVQLAVYAPNELAKGVYEKLGFTEVGRIPKKVLFHGELVDEIVMVKDL